MAGRSKVNTKFVVALSAGLLVAVAGVAVVAAQLLRNSAADLAKAGDRQIAAGNVTEAEKLYSRAVNKEQTNIAYLTTWLDLMRQSTPDDELKYTEKFRSYAAAIQKLADLQPQDVPAQQRFLDQRMTFLRASPFSSEGYTQLASEATSRLAFFEGKGAGPWDALRRYRGLVNARLYFESTDPNPTLLQGAQADLVAALSADPKDDESALTLVDIDVREAQRLRAQDRVEESKAAMTSAKSRAGAFLAANPDQPAMLLATVQLDLVEARAGLPRNVSEDENRRLTEAFVQRNRPLLDRAHAAALTAPQPLPERILTQMRQAELLLDPTSRLRRTEELIRAGLRAQPDNAVLLLGLADIQGTRAEFSPAMETLEQVTKLPNRGLGWEGQLLFSQRNLALAQQAIWSVRAWQQLPEGPDKSAMLERAQSLRSRLATVVGNDAPPLLLADAQLAFINGSPTDVQRAARLMDEYLRKVDRPDADALGLRAQIALRMNETGLARDTLQRMLAINPNNPMALAAMGDLERSFQNVAQAKTYYESALRLDPQNAMAKNGLAIVDALINPSQAADPVVGALVEMRRWEEQNSAAPDAGPRRVAFMRPLFEKNKRDPRLGILVASALLSNGQRDDAIAFLDDLSKANPDNANIRILLQRLKNPGIDGQLAIIDDLPNVPPIDKALQKFQILRAAGRMTEARAQLDAASAIDANDRRVVESLFIHFVEVNQLEQARPLVDRAVKDNLDGYNGDTFRARFAMAQGDVRQCIALLQGVIERGGASPEVHRLHGRALTADGRLNEAVEAYRNALRLRPTDPAAAADVVVALATAGRADEALTQAREFRRFAEGDERFLRVWLELEGRGGDANVAITRREQIAAAIPDDRANQLALAQLYLNAGKIDKARATIAALRTKADGMDAALLDGAVRWGTGAPDQARSTIEEAIAKLPKEQQTAQVWISYARFLVERGDALGAVAAMEKGRDVQDPKGMEADKALSELYSQLGEPDKSIDASRRVVAANADTPEKLFQKRIVETLLSQNKLDDAKTELDKLPSGASADAQTLQLSAIYQGLKGDARGQMDTLDQAVARFPSNADVFMARARALSAQEGRLRDAIADLDRAVDLRPSDPIPLRLRAEAKERNADRSGAEADLKAALRVNPFDNQLLFSVLTQLMRDGKTSQAEELANEIAGRRAGDVRLLVQSGDFFGRFQQREVALRFLRRAFEAEPRGTAQTYLDALLNTRSPDAAEATRVLNQLGEPVVKADPGLLMSSAKVRYAQGRAPEAARLAQDAVRMLDPAVPGQMLAWYRDASSMIPDKVQLRQFFQGNASQGIIPEWMTFFRAVSLIESDPKSTEALSLTEQVLSSTQNQALRLAALNTRGQLLFALERYPQAVEAWNAVLAIAPDDAAIINNVAYVMTTQMNKHEEALPLAAKAAQLSRGESADILDTLGVVYTNLGRHAEAAQAFERAGMVASTPEQVVTVGIHYANTLLTLGKKEEAKNFVTGVSRLVDEPGRDITSATRAKWQEVRDRVNKE